MKYLILLLKICFSSFLVYLAIKNINFLQFKDLMVAGKGPLLLAVGVTISLLQSVIGGIRLQPIVGLFGRKITAILGIRLWILGVFFSQFLISFIGGDAIRAIALSKSGVSPGIAIKAVFLDRVFGSIAIIILFLLTLPTLLHLITVDPMYWGILGLAGFSLTMVIGFLVMGLVPYRTIQNKFISRLLDISSLSRYLYMHGKQTIKIVCLSLLVHICSIYKIYFLTNALGGDIQLSQAFYVGSVVILISLLPLSISGWGVREGAMVVGFGLINISSEIALMVSILFGLSLLISSLPGVLVMLGKYKNINEEVIQLKHNGTN